MSGAVDSAVCGSSASLMITVSPGPNLESSQGYTEAENGLTIPSTINCNDGEFCGVFHTLLHFLWYYEDTYHSAKHQTFCSHTLTELMNAYQTFH